MDTGTLSFGHFELDCRARELRRNGRRTRLQEQPFQVLRLLIERAGQVVTREELRVQLWPGNVLVDFDHGLNNAIAKLREVLGDSADRPKYIETIPRLGYRFVFQLANGATRPDAAGAVERTPASSANHKIEHHGPSLAVLPFINLGDDPDQEYFVEGMMDEIVTALTRVRSLFVIASGATLSLKGQALDPQAVARRLNVRYILEGNVRRAGSKIRIAMKLTDARGGEQIWAERFEGTLEDVFAFQDHVALSVAGVIEPNIQAAELRRLARGPVENLCAYDLYLRAARLRAGLRKQDVLQALELLNRAIALEPQFAPALAHAAGCHSQIYFNGWADDREAHRHEGLMLAERAVKAGGDDASVLAQVANAVMDLDQDYDRANELIERATALNPGSAQAWFISGLLKMMGGHCPAAMECLQRAARLDPISHLNECARAHIGVGKAMVGEFEESVRILRATTYRTPRIQLTLLYAYERLGRCSQASEELQLYEQLTSIRAEDMVASLPIKPELRISLLNSIAQVRES